MSSTNPPNPNVNTFNNLYWSVSDIPLTQSKADKRYLKYPVAQGKETLQDIDVNGVANFNQPITMTGSTSTSRLIRSTNFAINNTTNNPVGNITASSIDVIYDNNRDTGKHIFKSNDNAGTETTIMTMDTSNVLVYDPLISSSSNFLNRVIGTNSYQILDRTTGINAMGIIECEAGNNNISYTNLKNSGNHNFLTKDAGGTSTIPITINSNGLIMNVLGDYIQFPDGTQQSTAAVTTALKTYTTAYIPSGGLVQTITIPANCFKVDILAIGGGGNRGTTIGPAYGGTGGGGQIASTTGGITVSPTQQFIIRFATKVDGTYYDGELGAVLVQSPTTAEAGNVTTDIRINGVSTNYTNVIVRCLNANNGLNATNNVTPGGGAPAGSVDPVTSSYATTWNTGRATAGYTGNQTLFGGSPRGSKWISQRYGCGAVAITDVIAGTGAVIITYYIN